MYLLAPQPELARVLWPVFMHVYLELVRRSASGPAHTLLVRHRPRFAGSAADAAPLPHAQVVPHADGRKLEPTLHMVSRVAICQTNFPAACALYHACRCCSDCVSGHLQPCQ